MMKFEWDEKKRLVNIKKHGIDFVAACRLWESPMLVVQDDREDYGETRWIGLGTLEDRIIVVVFTKRLNMIRIISCRKANKREIKYYEEAMQAN
jgi:uncharacterized DUF497 family protein